MLNRTLLFSVITAAVFTLFIFGTPSSASASEQTPLFRVDNFHGNYALVLGQGETRRTASLGDRFKQLINRMLPDDDSNSNHNHSPMVVPPAIPTQPPKPPTAAEIQQSQTPGTSNTGQQRPTGVASSTTVQQSRQPIGGVMPPAREPEESDEESLYQKLARLRQPVFTIPLEEAARQSRQSSNAVRPLPASSANDSVHNNPAGNPANGPANGMNPPTNPPTGLDIYASPGLPDISSVPTDGTGTAQREIGTRQQMPPQPIPQSIPLVPTDSLSPSQEAAKRIAALNTEALQEPEKQRVVSVSPLIEVEVLKPSSVVLNQEVTYRVKVTNTGNAPAERVVLTIGIPTWIDVRHIDASNGNVVEIPREDGSDATDLEWKINRISPGGTELLILRLVSQTRRTIELPIDYTFYRPTIIAKVEVQEPKLEMELLGADEVLWNDVVVYTLLVRNTGNGDAENLKLDLLQTNSSEEKSCVLPEPLRPGDCQAIDIQVRAGREQEHIDIAVLATGAHDLKGEIKRRIRVLRPRLEMSVQTQPLHLVDSPAEVFIRIRNVGTADAEKVNIRAELPLGANFDSCNEGGIFASQQQQNVVEWRGRTIERGEMLTFTLICRPRREGNCRVSVEASEASGSLLADGNASFIAEAVTELELAVIKPNGAVEIGQEAEYTIQLTNVGTKAVENVEASMAFGWKTGQKERISVLEPIAVGGGEADLDNGMVVFHKIPVILPKQSCTLKVIAKAIETGTVQIKTEVNGMDIHLTNGISTYVFSRTASAHAKPQQDEVFR